MIVSRVGSDHSFIHFVSRKLSMIMWSPSSSYRPLPLLLLLIIFLSCVNATRPNPRNGSVSAFFVFGDSTVDSGNNNFIKTISKSNFPPYGKDLPNHIPTGRFTNGRLATDFLGNYYFYLFTIFFFLSFLLCNQILLLIIVLNYIFEISNLY